MQLGIMLAITFVCCVLASKYLDYSKREIYDKALITKALASLCFVIVGGIAMTGCWYTTFGYLIFAGLCLGMIGDVLLAFRYTHKKHYERFFILGSAAFAAGHVCYIIALLELTTNILYVAVPYTLVGFVLSYVYARKNKVDAGRLMIPGTVYIAIVLFMGGCAAGAAVYALSPGTALFAVGGLFFAISDNILVVNNFGKKRTEERNRALHMLYYSAQIFIAFSMIMLFVL